MDVSRFDFDLPTARIADRPAVPRDASRLLLVDPHAAEGERLRDHGFRQLPDLLQPGDVLVVNDTRVILARLRGVSQSQQDNPGKPARVEITLHRQHGPTTWAAFVRPAKKLRVGDVVQIDDLRATVVGVGERGERFLAFDLTAEEMIPALQHYGAMPLPPYIEKYRQADEQDREDYQTLFAEREGAVAAPTAGLHFSGRVLAALEQRGIELVRVTLHVGAGSFLPVTATDTRDHRMHAEWGEIKADAAARLTRARAAGRRIIAVGTTSLRLLESSDGDGAAIRPFLGETSIFITPGYRFRWVDGLITNFHLPKSTLFMLVSAFSGLALMRAAYAHAIAEGYRFYSYGDSSLLWLHNPALGGGDRPWERPP